MPVRISALEPDPEAVAAVAELTAAVYRAGGYSSEQYEPALRDVGSRVREALVLVARDGAAPPGAPGALLGAATVATRGGRWADQAGPGEAVVRMLVVAPPARGRGVGEALMQACLEQARRDGCTLVRLSSQEEMTSAHRLYDRLGFTRTPEQDWSPEPGLVLRTYELALPSRAGSSA